PGGRAGQAHRPAQAGQADATQGAIGRAQGGRTAAAPCAAARRAATGRAQGGAAAAGHTKTGAGTGRAKTGASASTKGAAATTSGAAAEGQGQGQVTTGGRRICEPLLCKHHDRRLLRQPAVVSLPSWSPFLVRR